MGKSTMLLEIEDLTQETAGRPLVDENVYLIGRPPLRQFLNYVQDLSADAGSTDQKSLAEEWRMAERRVRELQTLEAGIADNPLIVPVERHLEPLRDQFRKNSIFRRSFNIVPSDICVVELDRLVVYQKHVNLEYVKQLSAKLGPNPDEETTFRMCLPLDRPETPVKWLRTDSDTYVFTSPSNDLRFLGSMMLDREQIIDMPRSGNVAGVVGLAVGFGSNFLNAICAEKRLVLNNGSHRAFALRQMGFTHAPCLIQYVSSREELRTVASSDLKRNPDVYLRQTRPSMLKDYFDPQLRKIVPVHRRLRMVRVKFNVEDQDLPAV